jgi:two-component system LytT family response regulator
MDSVRSVALGIISIFSISLNLMLRAIIIDDEKHSREALARLLAKNCPEVEVIAQCSNTEDAENAITEYNPDLIFLDVEMPGSGGFDLLKKLKEINFEIIFVTGFSQYAVQAIRFSALDYILKPIVPGELVAAVQRAGAKAIKQQQREKIDLLLNNIQYLNTDKKIALATLTGLVFVPIRMIIRCESDNTYTTFYLKDNTNILVSKSIGEFEELLMDYHFLRVHQSHLINLRYVKSYKKGEGGVVVMEDNSVVDVSRRRKEQLIARLSGM